MPNELKLNCWTSSSIFLLFFPTVFLKKLHFHRLMVALVWLLKDQDSDIVTKDRNKNTLGLIHCHLVSLLSCRVLVMAEKNFTCTDYSWTMLAPPTRYVNTRRHAILESYYWNLKLLNSVGKLFFWTYQWAFVIIPPYSQPMKEAS